jgi:hypothetical protein
VPATLSTATHSVSLNICSLSFTVKVIKQVVKRFITSVHTLHKTDWGIALDHKGQTLNRGPIVDLIYALNSMEKDYGSEH